MNLLKILEHLALPLVLTVLIETALAFVLKVRSIYDLIFVVLANCLTNPVVNLIYLLVMSGTDIENGSITAYCIVAILEVLAWGTEALLYKKLLVYKRLKPMILSLILNASSFGLGLIIL